MTTTIAVIGGSGLYDIEGLHDTEEVFPDTPFGKPSDRILTGTLHEQRVMFLARHGRKHTYSPSEVNFRANIFALKALGAVWCISVSAVGSLREEIRPGDMTVPDQVIDRTRGRAGSFFEGGLVAHVSMAEPYCPVLRSVLHTCAESVSNGSFKVHRGGTYVCMEGPAFSTRAESNLYRSWGASVIGMTNMPEAKLAREAEIAYATLALATDYDCWKADEKEVDVTVVIRRLQTLTSEAARIVSQTVKALGSAAPSLVAADSLKHAFLTQLGDVPAQTKERLRPIVGRYL